ncbi:hypothetical protein [Limnoraphis robusta]|uniref:Uncharacterized protein n=2 Tax=Limnoraphis robusta TaxID=1118279 RepID=A0A0F5YEQ2_9CYAN|nr:hypothetical protein [Limnoraphis robusta]KKD37233.1 hypothetical protein WN50_15495 [Limnoraphis robusta CS-951]MEA5497239.1 hypothetical protein [Limnoraphis robusta BA-68 BA1]MEA5518189.1 hypothetical protein [Limnoraphis robusta CCNP1315]MEA5543367.1 hypothetical protein [Limnoraphis robusta CCNP1324]
MEELKHLATWVKEQHAPEYILTWLLNQPGIWWSNGEVYQAALEKSGKRLKEYVKNSKQTDLFQGIADKIVGDESWDQIAISLARIIASYQEELVKLQDQNRLRFAGKILENYHSNSEEGWSAIELQQPLPELNADELTGQ